MLKLNLKHFAQRDLCLLKTARPQAQHWTLSPAEKVGATSKDPLGENRMVKNQGLKMLSEEKTERKLHG